MKNKIKVIYNIILNERVEPYYNNEKVYISVRGWAAQVSRVRYLRKPYFSSAQDIIAKYYNQGNVIDWIKYENHKVV